MHSGAYHFKGHFPAVLAYSKEKGTSAPGDKDCSGPNPSSALLHVCVKCSPTLQENPPCLHFFLTSWIFAKPLLMPQHWGWTECDMVVQQVSWVEPRAPVSGGLSPQPGGLLLAISIFCSAYTYLVIAVISTESL